MGIFNIKMMLQNTEWWPFLTFIKVYTILYIAHKLLKFMKWYAQRLGILKPSSLPGINTRLLYPYLLISHYKKSTPECPVICGFFESLIGLCRVYGKNGLFFVDMLFKPEIYIYRAEAIEALLGNVDEIDKGDEYRFVRPLFGDGLITSERTKWRKHRRLLTPAFHFSILEDCIPVFQEKANVLISIIESRIQEPWVDINSLSSLCALDIICQTAMGISMNIQNGNNSDYTNAFLELEENAMYRIFRPWLYIDIFFNMSAAYKKFESNLRLVREFNEKVLKQKMDKINEKDYNSTCENKSNKHIFEKKLRKPFLELLVEHCLKDPSFTENDIIDEVNTFMAAGHDTSAKAISWVLYCLGIYPEVQKKVHEELDTLLANEENENISREILSKMKYLECVIKETLRLYPVVPVLSRKTKHSFKVSNYTVKKGSNCVILIWELHRDPMTFPDAEKFIPERFLPENCTGRNPYAYIPFSTGPRNCIGQKFSMLEMKTVIACVLRRFRVKSLDPRDKVHIYPKITLGNTRPLRLRFECR